VWFGLCFVAVGAAYWRRHIGIYGKRSDGSIPVWRWSLLLPLHVYTLSVWHLIRLLSREPAISEVAKGLMIGRRLLAHEIPAEVRLVVDLTAEFREPPGIIARCEYHSFPILDATAPDCAKLLAFIVSLPDAPMYIHCAQGHGRTGLFTMAFLLARGHSTTLNGARNLVLSARPGVRLNGEQECFIRAMYFDNQGSRLRTFG